MEASIEVYRSRQNGRERIHGCYRIAIDTGLHVEPNIPRIPGTENLRGAAYHSSQYKQRSQGRDVLFLGCGETAMSTQASTCRSPDTEISVDIVYEAIKADAGSVTMYLRTGFLTFLKALSRFQVFGSSTSSSKVDCLLTDPSPTSLRLRTWTKPLQQVAFASSSPIA